MFYPALQKLIIREPLAVPSAQDGVDCHALAPPETPVFEIGVVDRFSDDTHGLVLDSEAVADRLKRAVVFLMAEAAILKHIEGNRIGMNLLTVREDKASLQIDEPRNQPRRGDAVNAGPRTGHPGWQKVSHAKLTQGAVGVESFDDVAQFASMVRGWSSVTVAQAQNIIGWNAQ